MSLKVGNKVYVPTPSHGFVEAEITNVKKEKNKIMSLSVKYKDDFIKETYGEDDVDYLENNVQKIVLKNKTKNGSRPYYWMFQNRKSFPKWVTETFKQYDSCNLKKNKNKKGFSFAPRQKFIRDYLGHESPYRGLLIYHGLGTGKTCASIAVSENLKDTRNIVILLPASLKNNFISKGLKKCGDPEYETTDGDNLINEKYTFVSYNASNVLNQLESVGSLNNKVIIVDEAHNLATMMVNGIRGMSKQGYEIYKLLLEAKNSKIIFLTGTPLVNTPFEIAILFNILRGPLEIVTFRVSDFREESIDSYISELIADERIGWVDFNRKNQSLSVILKLNSWDMEFEQTVRFVESEARKYNSFVNFDKTNKYTLFPELEEEFDDLFVRDDEFINEDMFQRRIVGLTSFFETTEETKKEFPEQLPDKIVKVEMSPHQFELYDQAREVEKKGERRAAQQRSTQRGEKVTTLARVFSREFSNFVFPDEVTRPFKKIKFMTKAVKERIKREKREKGIIEENENKNENKNEPKMNKETYDKLVEDALEKLSDPSKPYLKPGPNGLSRYSPKMEQMIEEINSSEKGLILVYSSFRTVEGLEVFSRVLEANGYNKFNPDKINKEDDFKRFAFYSGQEDMKLRKKTIETYTSPDNKYGRDIRILLVSSAGAEGLDLKNIRKVLIMDVFWHDVRIQQIIRRAVRHQSHFDLPENERNVQPIIYLSVFSEKQEELSREQISTDEHIYNLAQKKLQLNNDILKAVKESAIDCMLNQCQSKESCYKFRGDEEGLAYLPQIKEDIVYGFKHSRTKEIKQELVVSGINDLDEIVYKKVDDWYLGNGKKLKKKPKIVKGKKFGLDLKSLELFDYNSIKNKGIPVKVGTVNEKDGKINII